MKNNAVMKCRICNNKEVGKFIVIDNKKYHEKCIKQLADEHEKNNKMSDETKVEIAFIIVFILMVFLNVLSYIIMIILSK